MIQPHQRFPPGKARVVEDHKLAATLMPADYKARSEQAILFTVSAWSENCPQHIPQRIDAAVVATAMADRDRRIAWLEVQLARLQAADN